MSSHSYGWSGWGSWDASHDRERWQDRWGDYREDRSWNQTWSHSWGDDKRDRWSWRDNDTWYWYQGQYEQMDEKDAQEAPKEPSSQMSGQGDAMVKGDQTSPPAASNNSSSETEPPSLVSAADDPYRDPQELPSNLDQQAEEVPSDLGHKADDENEGFSDYWFSMRMQQMFLPEKDNDGKEAPWKHQRKRFKVMLPTPKTHTRQALPEPPEPLNKNTVKVENHEPEMDEQELTEELLKAIDALKEDRPTAESNNPAAATQASSYGDPQCERQALEFQAQLQYQQQCQLLQQQQMMAQHVQEQQIRYQQQCDFARQAQQVLLSGAGGQNQISGSRPAREPQSSSSRPARESINPNGKEVPSWWPHSDQQWFSMSKRQRWFLIHGYEKQPSLAWYSR